MLRRGGTAVLEVWVVRAWMGQREGLGVGREGLVAGLVSSSCPRCYCWATEGWAGLRRSLWQPWQRLPPSGCPCPRGVTSSAPLPPVVEEGWGCQAGQVSQHGVLVLAGVHAAVSTPLIPSLAASLTWAHPGVGAPSASASSQSCHLCILTQRPLYLNRCPLGAVKPEAPLR